MFTITYFDMMFNNDINTVCILFQVSVYARSLGYIKIVCIGYSQMHVIVVSDDLLYLVNLFVYFYLTLPFFLLTNPPFVIISIGITF